MKIAVAMSGGVDSTITALLLKEMGHEVIGITAVIETEFFTENNDLCFSTKHIEDAKFIAEKYNFPHYIEIVDEDFSKMIIDPFCNEYLKGRTPNPCIHCNPQIKFRRLLERSQKLGCEKLATGHYAKVNKGNNGRYYISMGSDSTKDQSYFLFMLSQTILQNIIFPLGDYKKDNIRKIAKSYNLAVANKPDSQEICFISDNDYSGYIEKRTNITPPYGDIVNKNNEKIGTHKGIHKYTIGQRRGLGISAPHPLYVIKINTKNNTIVAGYQDELKNKNLIATNIHYMKDTSLDNIDVLVKTRSTQSPVKAKLIEHEDNIIVNFEEPQIGISPGQAAVFYDENLDILGGGIIDQGY